MLNNDWLIDFQIVKFISDLGISKVQLRAEDIDMIMDTLVFDGKAERCEVQSSFTVDSFLIN
jgi:RNA polymerase Rpc34 subunit